jgi:hypothetical protein
LLEDHARFAGAIFCSVDESEDPIGKGGCIHT